jgi:hypothetical protein
MELWSFRAMELWSFRALELWQMFVLGEDASRKDGLLTAWSNLAYCERHVGI